MMGAHRTLSFVTFAMLSLGGGFSKNVSFLPEHLGKMIPHLTCTYFFKMGGPPTANYN